VFDGATYVDTGIKLLADGINPGWTIVADIEYADTAANATMLCAMQEDGYMGFKVKYANGATVQWGTNTLSADSGLQREMIVLRHESGSRNVTAYISRVGEMQIGSAVLSKTVDTVTDCTLILGAAKSDAGVFENYAKGILHSCQIWYGDLGDTVCQQIASWPRETYKLEAGTFGAYKLASDETQRSNIDFIFASGLSPLHAMNSKATNVGGYPASSMHQWMTQRVLPALPLTFRSIAETCRIKCMLYVDGTNYELETLDAKVFLPSFMDLDSAQREPQVYEGEKHIPYIIDNASRIKFNGPAKIPRDGCNVFRGNNDPSLNADNNVQDGDLWFDIEASPNGVGKLRVNGAWFTSTHLFCRTSSVSNTTYFAAILYYGTLNHTGVSAASKCVVVPRICI
jgi:hypothetical protein